MLDTTIESQITGITQLIFRSASQAINCARAMDGIKNLIAPNVGKDAQAWQRMQRALNVDAAYLKFITDLSKDARHGKLPILPETSGESLIERSWTIVDRYLQFLKRGGTAPLPDAQYPLLTG